MALVSPDNLYRGVNTHLHSELQSELAGWEQFHLAYIFTLGEAIRRMLPEGYVIFPERVMQIREYHPTTGDPVIVPRKKTFIPDAVIAGINTAQGVAATPPVFSVPSITLLDDDDEIYLRSLVIREIIEGTRGKPVTTLEVLSPTNKPPNGGYFQYREKRLALLDAGVALVEIDYLHETRSPIASLPNYLLNEPNSYPYGVVVTTPQPSFREGRTDFYGIRVDDPLPKVTIPLKGQDQIVVDFDAPYKQAYQGFSYSDLVDYGKLPVHFERYMPDDQARIRVVMERAAQQTQ